MCLRPVRGLRPLWATSRSGLWWSFLFAGQRISGAILPQVATSVFPFVVRFSMRVSMLRTPSRSPPHHAGRVRRLEQQVQRLERQVQRLEQHVQRLREHSLAATASIGILGAIYFSKPSEASASGCCGAKGRQTRGKASRQVVRRSVDLSTGSEATGLLVLSRACLLSAPQHPDADASEGLEKYIAPRGGLMTNFVDLKHIISDFMRWCRANMPNFLVGPPDDTDSAV